MDNGVVVKIWSTWGSIIRYSIYGHITPFSDEFRIHWCYRFGDQGKFQRPYPNKFSLWCGALLVLTVLTNLRGSNWRLLQLKVPISWNQLLSLQSQTCQAPPLFQVSLFSLWDALSHRLLFIHGLNGTPGGGPQDRLIQTYVVQDIWDGDIGEQDIKLQRTATRQSILTNYQTEFRI